MSEIYRTDQSDYDHRQQTLMVNRPLFNISKEAQSINLGDETP